MEVERVLNGEARDELMREVRRARPRRCAGNGWQFAKHHFTVVEKVAA